MARRIWLFLLAVSLAPAGVARAADDATERAARARYTEAFLEEVRPPECVEVLEEVVRQYPKSVWADDALWALGEIADRTGRDHKAILYRQALMARSERPKLEDDTKRLSLYESSRLPRIVRLLEMTGTRYRRKGIRAVAFNPLPMVAHEEIALGYSKLHRYDLAARHYKLARREAPDSELLRERLERQIERMEQKQALQEAEEAQAALEEEAAEARPAEPDPEHPVSEDAPEGEDGGGQTGSGKDGSGA